MATPEVSAELLERLGKVEDAVQESRFSHQVKVDATTNGLSILYAQHQRMQEELAGFRAEVAAEFGSVRADLDAVKTEQARQGVTLDEVQATLAEVLRRLPEPDAS